MTYAYPSMAAKKPSMSAIAIYSQRHGHDVGRHGHSSGVPPAGLGKGMGRLG